jgi:hypothetical protein
MQLPPSIKTKTRAFTQFYFRFYLFIHSFKRGSHYAAQASLKLMDSSNPPTPASQVLGLQYAPLHLPSPSFPQTISPGEWSGPYQYMQSYHTPHSCGLTAWVLN